MTETYITDDQLTHMRVAVAPIYMDTCQRLVYVAGVGDYGHGNDSYPAGAILSCLFVAKPTPDALPGTDVLQIDADIYLPRDTTLLPDDRLTITHLHGEALSVPMTFVIASGPYMDMVTMHAGLKRFVE